MTNLTKEQRIKAHLVREKNITSMEAIVRYRVTRLAAVIHRLRQDGWAIETEKLPMPEGGTYAKYHFKGLPEATQGKLEL